jgi:hypothetical protein
MLLGQVLRGSGRPILQHFDGFSTLFRRFRVGAKYLGDVDHVDDVSLIIATTPDAAVVYGTANL